MSRVLKLVTGNVAHRQPNKVAETQQILGATLERLGITLVRVDIDCMRHSVEEIQGSAEEVILAKIKEAVKKDGGVVMCEDTSLCFKALGGLPGPYMYRYSESGFCTNSVQTVYRSSWLGLRTKEPLRSAGLRWRDRD